MSDVIPISVEWLSLREDADARSRSRPLARKAARMTRVPVVVHDLGSGTGSMMRWLAPLLPGPQTWVLHDWNDVLLDRAAHGASDSTGHPPVIRTRVRDVGELSDADLVGASLVTMSALLDVLTREEAETIVRACVAAGAPALVALSVTGRVEIEPFDPGDRVFESAFNDHQRRTTAGRALLGPDAAATVTELFTAAGWRVRADDSPWRLDSSETALVREWLEGWVGAAVEERPTLEEWAEEYLRTRGAQLAAGALRVTVHHLDLLAWPP
ncbi:hypothetical protein SAMN04487846_2966 [Microbacterium sp. cf046]|uniref:class I SAM-dependent methyltransferase n=1 Tax=Microbacterium sp. cf046 TaxID=1761803 RepID=UPI0008E8D993|nr:class I SAM-dependent methyltransferase [Microbacterium sp. cf046]SFS14668.1 hypothetical protein SAMN04487846_2966 [Microbacterium sp. cf046]